VSTMPPLLLLRDLKGCLPLHLAAQAGALGAAAALASAMVMAMVRGGCHVHGGVYGVRGKRREG